ncbi:DNA-binding protein HU-beta [Pseudonocardia thermophila]|uniref:DNA-binding protein HU-beta n=1 Tax=Pseudonocardia thermophila TaxID=1848 RepID=A0A1M6QKH8_PSETH|nr:HU family DNA-binding protein [Pseudonocardia thermophila]SHK20553.1 DNA-binding protein HU-beta [Pseudonocardia thermophila]
MNKSQLVHALAERLGDRRIAATAVDGLLETIVETVRTGEPVSITGFGVFESRERAARTARNPRTGETVEVPAATVPAFRPGTGFRNAVGGGAAAQPAAATATSTTAVEAPVEAPAEESPKPTKKTRSKQSFAADTEPEKTAKPGKKAKASEEQASEGKAEGKAEGKVKGGKKTKAKDGAEKPKAKRGKK